MPNVTKTVHAFLIPPMFLIVEVDSPPPEMTEQQAEHVADLVTSTMEGVVAVVKPLPLPA